MSKVRRKDVVATRAEAEFMDDIARYFNLRRYQKAYALIEASLEDHSWLEVVSLLKRIPFRLIERRCYRKREIPPWMLLRHSVTAVDVGKMRDLFSVQTIVRYVMSKVN